MAYKWVPTDGFGEPWALITVKFAEVVFQCHVTELGVSSLNEKLVDGLEAGALPVPVKPEHTIVSAHGLVTEPETIVAGLYQWAPVSGTGAP